MTEKGLEFGTINYVEEPLSAVELKLPLQQAVLNPRDVLRNKEDAYCGHVASKHLDDEQLLPVMAQHPELIQRPIIGRGNKAVLAREIEKLEDLFG